VRGRRRSATTVADQPKPDICDLEIAATKRSLVARGKFQGTFFATVALGCLANVLTLVLFFEFGAPRSMRSLLEG
jgi:hypothetical protein